MEISAFSLGHRDFDRITVAFSYLGCADEKFTKSFILHILPYECYAWPGK